MPRLLFFLLAFLNMQLQLTSGMYSEAPVYDKGRFHPRFVIQKNSLQNEASFQMLPSKRDPALWLPLSELSAGKKNFTAYSNSAYQKILSAYLANDLSSLERALLEGYNEIAGKPYLVSSNRTLTFPTAMQLKAENLYFRFPWIIFCLCASFGALLAWAAGYSTLSTIFIWASYLFLCTILGIRIYVLERPPVSNMFETLLFVPWLALTFSLFFKRQAKPAVAALTTLLLTILVLAPIENRFDNVQAVLDSNYWLTVHVLLVVGSYALFLIAGLSAHGYLFCAAKDIRTEALNKLIKISMYGGLAMLIPGTILGGIWAAVSWGRFWDWDPKESWAFITICAYLIAVHAHRYQLIGNFGLACFALFGAWIVTFTWYGVNYILGTGLHSYGFGEGGAWIYLAALCIDAAVCIPLAIAAKEKIRVS